MTLFDLSGKKALVTGASRGLGQAMAWALAEAGADVAVNARREASLEETARRIEALGRQAPRLAADVGDEEAVKRMVAQAEKDLGGLDILVNNAGVWEGTYFFRLKKEDWDQVVRVNMTGAFLVAKWAARSMLRRRCGKIINVASILGLRGSREAIAYCATKGALIQMTRVMALELAGAGIQVNAIAPGLFATDMTKQYTEDPEAMEKYRAMTPSKRYGRPEELSGLTLLLASRASDHITGQTIPIDGGESLI